MPMRLWGLENEGSIAYRTWVSDPLDARGSRILWKCRYCGRFIPCVDMRFTEDNEEVVDNEHRYWCINETCQILAKLEGRSWE